MNIKCIDLFCGAGGLTKGFESLGLNVVAGFDFDPACEHPYSQNNGANFVFKDITKVTAEELLRTFGEADIKVLAGGAPCQPFSTYSQRYETVGTARWRLLYKFAELIEGVNPEIVVMENVANVTKHTVFNDFLSTLQRLGYFLFSEVIDCSDFGLPQTRKRNITIASKLAPFDLVSKQVKNPSTVENAIGHIPSIQAGEPNSFDPLHISPGLSSLNLSRIRHSKPGGSWRDWPEELIAACHNKPSGRTYPGVYARMSWQKPSPTLTTQFFGFGNGRFGHPEQDRAISLREGAILQGFPMQYSFVPKDLSVSFKPIGRMIGNAVPVTLARLIGLSLLNHLAIVDPVQIRNTELSLVDDGFFEMSPYLKIDSNPLVAE